MNEQIKQLAEQAEIYVDRFHADDTKESYWIKYKEKFAELIVRECAEQIITGVRTNPPQAEPPELVRTLVRRIQQHFGVEE